jgi:hypothetical protein
MLAEHDFTGFKLTYPPAFLWSSGVFSASLPALSPVQLETDITWDVIFAISFHHSEELDHELWIIFDGFKVARRTYSPENFARECKRQRGEYI